MSMFKLLFPILDKLFTMASWDPVEDIKANNQWLAANSEGRIKIAGNIPGKGDKVVSKPEMVKLRRQRKQQDNG